MLDWASKACILREFLKETKSFNFTMSIHSVILGWLGVCVCFKGIFERN
jgi:hypothetical protein